MIEGRRDFAQPQWRGEAAEGKTLLLHAEQGFGDTLQFCRYVPHAAARGLRVIVQAPKPLVRLLRSLRNVDRVVADDEALPPFDLHCPMLSIPLAMGTTPTSIPGDTPYLHADPAQAAVWRTYLTAMANTGPRIGLVWAGTPHSHEPALAAQPLAPERLASLFVHSGAHFFSLQKAGPAALGEFPLIDLMDEMEDLADTAALIANLDLVISVDTAVAHLAAALGKPVWLLDRFDACRQRRDSPWYPTLRIYRQPGPGDWDAVLAEVVGDLHGFAAAWQRPGGDTSAIRLRRLDHERHRAEQAPSRPVMQNVSPDVQAMFGNGLEHHWAGRLTEAERFYGQVLAADSRHADSLHLLGVIAHQTGRHDLALELAGRAISVSPESPSYHNSLGTMLQEQGRLNEAVLCYRRAIDLKPDNPEAYYNLGNAVRDQRRLDEAVASYRKAIDLKPDFQEAHNNLGNTLREQGHLDEAVAYLGKAVDLKPSHAETHHNLGYALQEQRRLDEAIICYRRALSLDPEVRDSRFSLGMALLARGDMAEGWQAYEWRWKSPMLTKGHRDFAQPRWRGEVAEGKTLLLHAEQGFGDTLQFCRYAPHAAARGLRVIVQAPKPLVRLLRSLRNVDRVVADGEALPPFDLHCPMLSMPLAMGTTLTSIPGDTPYLHADPAQAAVWRTRLTAMANTGPRIGLVWAGNPRSHEPALAAVDRRRSLAPERLAPLFAHSGAHFFSLQRAGPAAPGEFPLIDFMGEMEDFADTAALTANLDLVISVDTAVVHVAAALGKPVWLLDRFDACWRWLTGRRDSPWYPTLRIYRQPSPGDWGAVLNEVAGDLSGFTGAWQRAPAEAPLVEPGQAAYRKTHVHRPDNP